MVTHPGLSETSWSEFEFFHMSSGPRPIKWLPKQICFRWQGMMCCALGEENSAPQFMEWAPVFLSFGSKTFRQAPALPFLFSRGLTGCWMRTITCRGSATEHVFATTLSLQIFSEELPILSNEWITYIKLNKSILILIYILTNPL